MSPVQGQALVRSSPQPVQEGAGLPTSEGVEMLKRQRYQSVASMEMWKSMACAAWAQHACMQHNADAGADVVDMYK